MYKRLHIVDDDPLVAHDNGRLYEIDAKEGTLVDSWPLTQLPIGDTVVDLDGEVQVVLDGGSRIFVRCREGASDLLAFDENGNELWRSDASRGTIHLEDGILYEKVSHGPRYRSWYRIDKDTGERTDEVESPGN